jgi:hypothetical protein
VKALISSPSTEKEKGERERERKQIRSILDKG